MQLRIMNINRKLALVAVTACLAVAALGATPQPVKEVTLDVFQIGTQFYTNATVTTSPTHISVTHSRGMETMKVASLPVEVREQLGYEIPKPKSEVVAGWAKAQVAKINVEEADPQMKAWQARLVSAARNPAALDARILSAVVSFLLVFYLFFSYCAALICRKTGNEPGPLIWVPILQILPLLRAAGMAPVWFIAWLLPVVNIIAQIVWSFKISEARNKGPLTAIFLILPFTNVFAFLYLALSGGNPAKKEEKPKTTQIMTLEAA